MCQTVQFLSPSDENVVSVFGSCEPFALCCTPFFELCDHGVVSIPHWVVKSDRLSPDDDRLLEDYCHKALAFSRHTFNLEFDEETMKPEKAPRNAGIDPSTMKINQWYLGHDRVSDQKAPTGNVTCLHQYRNELPIREFEKTE